jgi:hypothetical protein
MPPVPVALCVPLVSQIPAFDPKTPYADMWRQMVLEPECEDKVWSSTAEHPAMEQTIEILERHNIIGIASGSPQQAREWHAASPDRVLPAIDFRLDRDDISPDSMRALFASGDFVVFGEIENQYGGIAPDDERMEPYWALAEEYDIPVAIHISGSYPGASYVDAPKLRVGLTDPFLLEGVLNQHPHLRVAVMHYASPMVDEMIAMLAQYPQLYVDLGGIEEMWPRKYFYKELEQMIDAGFEKRIMFGSDQMIWPELIERAIEIIDEAPFLSEDQKRDIFYNNAARFLRWHETGIPGGEPQQPTTSR